ncbi:hypothetical protein [Acaryochloris marina]|uniref:Uncharacterized protein n=1 Tax=Acaryochloris marina (strain MBIC 11017) TaxID=329726 RepID=A8ZN99_ACAM1|nr:hypothetical protein [Acaryochloris marina]ABW32298.1 hypothetical protein AM1_C0371 [Acaryochloris marina MBIC11017]
MSILENNERIEALRERKQINDNQQFLMQSAQRRRDHEYRMAVLGDVSYWGWLVVLVALIAGFGGWWLRGTIAPTSANDKSGIFTGTTQLNSQGGRLSVTSNQVNQSGGTLPGISNRSQ